MKKDINKIKAFTLAEVLLTLSILGVLIAITTPIIKNALPNFNIYRIKKINITLKDAIDYMLNKNIQYEGQHDFSNTGYMVQGIEYVANVRTFRQIFVDTIDMKDTFECNAYGAGKITCYVSLDNFVWAIPDTNFENSDNGSVIVELDSNNSLGSKSKYVPITVYPDYKEKKAKENPDDYMKNNAVFYGVRRDGKIIFIEDINCDNNPRSMQCLAITNVGNSRMKRR